MSQSVDQTFELMERLTIELDRPCQFRFRGNELTAVIVDLSPEEAAVFDVELAPGCDLVEAHFSLEGDLLLAASKTLDHAIGAAALR